MGTVDLKNVWLQLADLEANLLPDEHTPHEETDLHRVFCDDRYCLERGAITATEPTLT